MELEFGFNKRRIGFYISEITLAPVQVWYWQIKRRERSGPNDDESVIYIRYGLQEDGKDAKDAKFPIYPSKSEAIEGWNRSINRQIAELKSKIIDVERFL